MQIPVKQLKPLNSVQLSPDESKILKWFRSVKWEENKGVRETTYKAKVPEFFNGVRLYRMQAGGSGAGSQGALELFIKKLEYQSVLTKQELYPVTTEGTARYLSLRKADLDNLGVGQDEEDEL